MRYVFSFALCLFYLGFTSLVYGEPKGITLQGTITNSSGIPLEESSVLFIVEIYSSGVNNCLLYKESHTINMTSSHGAFSFVLGSGTRSGSSFEDTSTLLQVFNNHGGTLSSLVCSVGNSYNPGPSDSRKISLSFDDGVGSGLQVLSQTINVQSVPFALYANSLQGKAPSDFVQNIDGTTQTKFSSVFDTRYTVLDNLLNGTSNLYTGANGSNFLPTSTLNLNSQVISNVASPSAAGDAVNKSYSDSNIAGKGTDSSTLASLGAGDSGKVLSWNGTQWTATSGPQWTTSGSNIYYNSGNIGIGTATPTSPLDVIGTIKTSALQITSGATNGYVLTSDASGNASWAATSSNSEGTFPLGVPSTVPSSGTVQIFALGNGVPTMTSNTAPSGIASASTTYPTTPAWNAFAGGSLNGWISDAVAAPHWLQYQFPSAKVVNAYSITPWSVDSFPTRSPNTWKLQGSNDGTNYVDLDSQTNFTAWAVNTPALFTINNSTAYTHYRLYITANGGNPYAGLKDLSLLVGEASPSGKSPYLFVRDPAVSIFEFPSDIKPVSINVPWTKNGTTLYYNSGNVGVGTTTPQAKLDITDATTSTSAIIVPRAGNFTGTSVNGMIRYNTTSTLFEFYQNGSWVNYTSVSDGRLKTNIRPVTEGLDIVDKLNPVYYNWDIENPKTTSFENKHQVGFIAQEVEEVLPEVVNKGEDSYRSIEYGKIVAVVVAAVKELYLRITGNEEKIQSIESQLKTKVENNEFEALKAEISLLRKEIEELKAKK